MSVASRERAVEKLELLGEFFEFLSGAELPAHAFYLFVAVRRRERSSVGGREPIFADFYLARGFSEEVLDWVAETSRVYDVMVKPNPVSAPKAVVAYALKVSAWLDTYLQSLGSDDPRSSVTREAVGYRLSSSLHHWRLLAHGAMKPAATYEVRYGVIDVDFLSQLSPRAVASVVADVVEGLGHSARHAVFTGGGVHVLVELEKPVRMPDVVDAKPPKELKRHYSLYRVLKAFDESERQFYALRRLGRDLCSAVEAALTSSGLQPVRVDKNVFNTYLRVPGTLNHKRGVVVEALW